MQCLWQGCWGIFPDLLEDIWLVLYDEHCQRCSPEASSLVSVPVLCAPLATRPQALEGAPQPRHPNLADYTGGCFLLPDLLDSELPATLQTKTVPLTSVTPLTKTTWGLPV